MLKSIHKTDHVKGEIDKKNYRRKKALEVLRYFFLFIYFFLLKICFFFFFFNKCIDPFSGKSIRGKARKEYQSLQESRREKAHSKGAGEVEKGDGERAGHEFLGVDSFFYFRFICFCYPNQVVLLIFTCF